MILVPSGREGVAPEDADCQLGVVPVEVGQRPHRPARGAAAPSILRRAARSCP